MAPCSPHRRSDRNSPKGIGMSLNDGFLRLGVLPWVDGVVDHLSICPRYPGHIKARPRDGMECNSMEDVMGAPHFLRYAKSLTPIVSKYFQEPAILWSLNAFYTDRNTPYFPGLHGLHKDRGGEKIVALFVLGFDTPIDSAQLHMRFDGTLELLYGPAGTAWLSDPDATCFTVVSFPRVHACYFGPDLQRRFRKSFTTKNCR